MDLGQPVQAEYNSETFDQSSEADRVQQYLEKRTTKKEKSIEIAVALWSTAANLHKLAKDQRDEISDLRKQLMESQGSFIALQQQKLQEKSETASELKEVMKTELKLYSGVVGQSTSTAPVTVPSTAQLRKVVKTVVEEEDRSRNLVVFGLREMDESVEDTEKLVDEICEQIGEKPRVITSTRVGPKREGATRPILVSLESAASVQQLLYRARELKGWEKYGKVFMGPDRSKDERVARKELVQELKRKREGEPGKRFVIRSNEVVLRRD